VRLHLNTYAHKGYWYHGGDREQDTMHGFARLIKQSDMVLELGGHIGFITQYFSALVGDDGEVIVFEPGLNNLPYIRKNIEHLPNTVLVEAGVGDFDGNATFYEDALSGQNNSLLEEYDVLKHNKQISNDSSNVAAKQISVVKVDSFLKNKQPPDFIKIDVEGYEYKVLQGMSNTLKNKPKLMIEITRNQKEIHDLIGSYGYQMLDDKMRPIQPEIFCQSGFGNYFCV